MTVVDVVKDADARTLSITARFAAPIARVWQVWSDPRRLERWWGPPGPPAADSMSMPLKRVRRLLCAASGACA